jgi:hypothetical protein
MGNISAVRIKSDTQTITQQEHDRVAASLKANLCSGDEQAVCEQSVDAALEQAMPVTYDAVDVNGTPTGEKVATPSILVVQAAVQYVTQNAVGENWAFTVQEASKSKSDVSMAADGTMDHYCTGGKSTYSTGIKVTYGSKTAWAPLYSYVQKTPYACLTGEEYQAQQLQQMLGY